ncbi:unnamed protein product, partial [Laminaria digitata]
MPPHRGQSRRYHSRPKTRLGQYKASLCRGHAHGERSQFVVLGRGRRLVGGDEQREIVLQNDGFGRLRKDWLDGSHGKHGGFQLQAPTFRQPLCAGDTGFLSAGSTHQPGVIHDSSFGEQASSQSRSQIIGGRENNVCVRQRSIRVMYPQRVAMEMRTVKR